MDLRVLAPRTRTSAGNEASVMFARDFGQSVQFSRQPSLPCWPQCVAGLRWSGSCRPTAHYLSLRKPHEGFLSWGCPVGGLEARPPSKSARLDAPCASSSGARRRPGATSVARAFRILVGKAQHRTAPSGDGAPCARARSTPAIIPVQRRRAAAGLEARRARNHDMRDRMCSRRDTEAPGLELDRRVYGLALALASLSRAGRGWCQRRRKSERMRPAAAEGSRVCAPLRFSWCESAKKVFARNAVSGIARPANFYVENWGRATVGSVSQTGTSRALGVRRRRRGSRALMQFSKLAKTGSLQSITSSCNGTRRGSDRAGAYAGRGGVARPECGGGGSTADQRPATVYSAPRAPSWGPPWCARCGARANPISAQSAPPRPQTAALRWRRARTGAERGPIPARPRRAAPPPPHPPPPGGVSVQRRAAAAVPWPRRGAPCQRRAAHLRAGPAVRAEASVVGSACARARAAAARNGHGGH